ncbi:hypothetical protein [Neisseria sp. HMSC31F04]|nr:hypothetical protein [Neisseria sp. HMSC31F04]
MKNITVYAETASCGSHKEGRLKTCIVFSDGLLPIPQTCRC